MRLYELEKQNGKIKDKSIWKLLVKGNYKDVRFVNDNDVTYAVIGGGALGAYNNKEGWGIIDAPDEIEEKGKI